MDLPQSCARAAASDRGPPRNTTPQTFTKHASAKAPVTPNKIAAGMAAHAEVPRPSVASTSPRNTSHSLTKPLSGGSPQMATAPSANNPAVHGIGRHKPPRRLISRVPVACNTEPAPKNNSALNKPWFQTCSSPPASASKPHLALPCSTAAIANPSPIRIMPMFSTL